MHTNMYENRKVKELNLEWIFKKQAQLQPPTWADHLIPGLIFFLGNYNT